MWKLEQTNMGMAFMNVIIQLQMSKLVLIYVMVYNLAPIVLPFAVPCLLVSYQSNEYAMDFVSAMEVLYSVKLNWSPQWPWEFRLFLD